MLSLGSFGTLASKIFGSSNDRRVKGYRARVEAINALEPEIEKLSDAELRARTDTFRQQYRDGTSLDDLLVPAFATVREAARRTLGQRHFDVQLIGGMVLHEGNIAEMKTGEGKTLVATLPVYLNALAGEGRARRHRQRLPRQARRRLDGSGLPLPRPHGRHHRARPRRRAAQGGLRRRRHLRHQQRVRLRLPARQHEAPTGRDGAARPCLRHRRRGGLHPDRRGAHAAHHFGPPRGPRRPLRRGRRAGEGAGGRARPHRGHARQVPFEGRAQGGAQDARLRRARREAAPGGAQRAWQRAHGAAARGGEAAHRLALRHRERLPRPPCQPGAQGAQALPARQGLHRQGRRGHHHR